MREGACAWCVLRGVTSATTIGVVTPAGAVPRRFYLMSRVGGAEPSTIRNCQAPKALGLQVTAAGSIAWVRDRSSPQASRYEVVAAQRGASPVVVEEGPVKDFAAGSLATAGGYLYWFAQGRAKSASLR